MPIQGFLGEGAAADGEVVILDGDDDFDLKVFDPKKFVPLPVNEFDGITIADALRSMGNLPWWK